MLKSLICAFFFIISIVPALGQQSSSKSLNELRLLLQQSKQDSNRVLLLHALGSTYLDQDFSDKKGYLMDTAICFFEHAFRLCDTIRLKSLQYESMLLAGETFLNRDNIEEGEKRFFEVASIYHTKGDLQKEGDTWYRLARKLVRYNKRLTEMTAFFDKAIALNKLVHNIYGEAESRVYLSEYLFTLAKFNSAEIEALQALKILGQIRNNTVTKAYIILSMINRYSGSYEKALLYATKGVESAEYKNIKCDAVMYGELALVYDELGRAGESSLWYRKTLDKRIERKSDRVYIFRTAGLLIRQLIKLKKSRAALALMDSLVAMGPPQNSIDKGVVAQNYAFCFDALKRYPEAEKYFLATVAYHKESPPEIEFVSLANMDLGRFYLQHQQFKKAHAYLNTALGNVSEDHLVAQKELFQMLFTVDSALGNNVAAIKDLQQYQYINDSIYNERKSRQIEELTIQYETQKKEQSIRLLENGKRLQQNELTKGKNTIRWTIGVTLLLIVIIGLLVNNTRLKQRTNSELQVQQKQIEKKNNSLQELVAEKEWLVREIHHRVKNNFHMVMGLLRTQAAYLQSEEAIQAVTESSQRIQAMSLVHQKLYQSVSLSAINMADYIHELVDYLKDSFHTGYTIRFNLQIDPVKFNVSHSIPLGLILNEAVTNAIKHAFPGKKEGMIDISLKTITPNHFLLAIKDNGIGLPAAFDAANQTSMGMKLMRGLSDDLDATFQVNKNNGTEILLYFTGEAESNN
jgi:two-component sensor histidine kinase